jgi:AcrR family transcriptional regulator
MATVNKSKASKSEPAVAKTAGKDASAQPKTRDRILAISLEMFNAQGEPNVTTNHIADELEISPGNLYYHFRNKDDIVEHLFTQFEAQMDQALLVPEGRLPTLDDMWFQMHLVFECIWKNRFIYRDLVDLLSRNRKLKMHFSRILKRAQESIVQVCRGLVNGGIMSASLVELDSLAQNVSLATTFWLNFEHIRPATTSVKQDANLGRGIYQVMMLLCPFLREAERAHLNKLAQQYVG